MNQNFTLLTALVAACTSSTFGPPVIIIQPQHQANLIGTDATFAVEARGTQA